MSEVLTAPRVITGDEIAGDETVTDGAVLIGDRTETDEQQLVLMLHGGADLIKVMSTGDFMTGGSAARRPGGIPRR